MNEDQTNTAARPRRTVAIWLATGSALLFTAGNLASVVERHHDFFTPVLAAIGGASFASLLCYPRSRTTYFLTLIFLTLLVGRGFIVDVILVSRPPSHGPGTVSYSWYAFNTFIDFLLLLLLWRYTFGPPTRDYYGLSSTPKGRNA